MKLIRTTLGYLSIAALLLLVACGSEGQTHEHPEETTIQEGRIISEPVGPEKFSAHLNDDGAILLDVRTEEEIMNGVIPGATYLEYGTPEMKEGIANMDKDATILVYCAAGARSGKVREILLEQGFQTVYDLVGGITAWEAAGMAIEKP